MSDASSLPPVSPGTPEALRGAAPPRRADRADGTHPGAGGPAFEALLERLEARAAELEARSKTFERPEELPEAVDAARASLADALALGAELLEAYRAAERRGPAPEEP